MAGTHQEAVEGREALPPWGRRLTLALEAKPFWKSSLPTRFMVRMGASSRLSILGMRCSRLCKGAS